MGVTKNPLTETGVEQSRDAKKMVAKSPQKEGRKRIKTPAKETLCCYIKLEKNVIMKWLPKTIIF